MDRNIIYFSSCDTTYFELHGKSFINSVLQNTAERCWVNVINPTKEVYLEMRKYTNPRCIFSCTIKDFSSYSVEEIKVYYAIDRYLTVNNILLHNTQLSFLIVDIDSYINKSQDISFLFNKSIGLYMRNRNPFMKKRKKVAAGLVFIGNKDLGLQFIAMLYKKIMYAKELYWYLDQELLYQVYIELRLSKSREFFVFNKRHLDWEFKDDSWIWTGKGMRKYLNERYVTRKAEFECQS